MDGTTRGFVLKVVGGLIAIGLGAALLWMPPAALAGEKATVGTAFVFLTGGLLAFGVNIGATVAAGREAALLRMARRKAPPPK